MLSSINSAKLKLPEGRSRRRAAQLRVKPMIWSDKDARTFVCMTHPPPRQTTIIHHPDRPLSSTTQTDHYHLCKLLRLQTIPRTGALRMQLKTAGWSQVRSDKATLRGKYDNSDKHTSSSLNRPHAHTHTRDCGGAGLTHQQRWFLGRPCGPWPVVPQARWPLSQCSKSNRHWAVLATCQSGA